MGGASALGNIFTSSALALAGVFALALFAWARQPQPLPRPVAGLAFVSLVALALDEGLELHDRAGSWLWREHDVVAPGPINHVDDLFLIGYLAAGATVGLALLPRLMRFPRFLGGLVASGSLFVLGTGFDALGTSGSWTDVADEGFEAAGALMLACTFGLQARSSIAQMLSERRRQLTAQQDSAMNDSGIGAIR